MQPVEEVTEILMPNTPPVNTDPATMEIDNSRRIDFAHEEGKNIEIMERLKVSSENFKLAESQYDSRNWVAATESYAKALTEVTDDPHGAGVIEYKLGVVYFYALMPHEAIATWKNVIANDEYKLKIKAFSVQQLLSLLYVYGDVRL